MKPLGCCLLLLLGTVRLHAAEPAWEEFASPTGRYRVSVPGKPQEKVSDKPGTPCSSIVVEDRDLIYLLAAGDIPNADQAVKEEGFATIWLDRQRDRAVQKLKGKLVKEDKLMLEDKHPGRSLVIQPPEKGDLVRSQLVLDGLRFYQLTVTGPKKAVESADADRFLQSFKVGAKQP